MAFFEGIGGGGGGGITLSPSVAALSTLGTGLPNGYVVEVTGNQASLWTLGPADNGVPTSVTRAPSDDGRTWYRDTVRGTPGTASQQFWYIDPVSGHDTNDGLTPGTALQTWDEFSARLGDQVIDGYDPNLPGTIMYVQFLNGRTYIAGDQMDVRAHFTNKGGLAILGTKTTVVSDTIAAVTPWAAATGVIGAYTLTTNTTASHVGQMIEVSSGPNQGVKTPIAKSTGAKQFRGNFFAQDTGVPTDPSVSDPVNIYTVTQILGEVHVEALGDGTVYFQDIELGVISSPHSVVFRTGQIQAIACILHGCDIWQDCDFATVQLCLTYDFRVYGYCIEWGNVHMSTIGTALDVRAGGTVIIYGQTLVQSYGVVVGHQLEGVGTLVVSDPGDGGGPLAVADYSTQGFLIYPGSTLVCHDYIFCRDSVSSAASYQVMAGGLLAYDSAVKPLTAGTAATQFSIIGGTTKASAAIPFFNSTSGGAFVVNQ